MDIDPGPSSSKRTPVSPPSLSSSEKRRKTDLMSAQQQNINNNMKAKKSKMVWWENRLREAEDDESEWNELSTDILLYIVDILADAGREGIIPPQTLRQAEKIVAGLTGSSLEQWKDGVRKGVQVGNWDDLVRHRACCSKRIV
jgi:hypothetical protein